LLELQTYRRTGHSRRDPCHYQPKEERAFWSANDPITRYAQALLAGGNADSDDLDRIQKKIDDEIESAVEKAKTAPKPEVEDLLTDVYAS
jgi:pyruvate dehydrogenase E1 component alpha subunit